jgi:2-keto-3-deoxy-6-phosphogluconate aldolase
MFDVENHVTTCRHLQVEAVVNVNTPSSLIGAGTVLHTPPLEPAV